MTGKVVISKWWKQALATWSVHGVFSPLSSTSGFCSETFALKISSKGQDGHVACIANGCPAIRELPETNHLNSGKLKYHALPLDWWFAQTIPFLLITIFIPFQIFVGTRKTTFTFKLLADLPPWHQASPGLRLQCKIQWCCRMLLSHLYH